MQSTCSNKESFKYICGVNVMFCVVWAVQQIFSTELSKHCMKNKFDWSMQCLEIMRLLKKQLHCTLLSLFLLCFLFHLLSLSLLNSVSTICDEMRRLQVKLQRRYLVVSARLKLADSVACNSACEIATGQLNNVRHVTCFKSQSACSHITCW